MLWVMVIERFSPSIAPKIDRHARGKGREGGSSPTPMPFVGREGVVRRGEGLAGQVGGDPAEFLDTQRRWEMVVKTSDERGRWKIVVTKSEWPGNK